MQIDWTGLDGRCIRAVYFPKEISLHDIEKYAAEGVDKLLVWYPSKITEDIHMYYDGGLSYIGLDGGWGKKEHSLRIDLRQDADTILTGMHNNRRYKVKRCKNRDCLKLEIRKMDDDELEHYYLSFQNAGENAHVVDEDLVHAAIRKECFYLGICKSDEDEILAMHAWLVDKKRKW